MTLATNATPRILPGDVKRAAILSIAAAGGCAVAGAAIALSVRTSLGIPLGIGVATFPLAAVAILKRPLVVLFSLYAVLVPIDAALLVGQSLTITKILGIAAAFGAIVTIFQRRAQLTVPYAVFGWAGLVGLMALSICWTVDPALTLQDVGTVVSSFALLVVMSAVPIEPSEFKAIVGATIASGVVVGIVAIVMARHELSTIAGQVGRLYLTFGSATEDPNRFGASLLLPVALTVAAIIRSRGWARAGLLLISPLPFTAIYLTASRGTTLALIAMAIVAILASKYRLTLTAVLAAAIGLFFAIPNEIASRFLEERGAVNAAGRFDIWRVAIEVFRGHWLLGSGVGAFPTAYDRAFLSAYEAQFAGWTRAPHSLLISTSTELGVVGIVVTIVALTLQYRSLRLIGPGPYGWARVPFAAAFVALLVAAMFVDVLETKFAWLLFTEMLLAARLAASHREREPQRPAQDGSSVRAPVAAARSPARELRTDEGAQAQSPRKLSPEVEDQIEEQVKAVIAGAAFLIAFDLLVRRRRSIVVRFILRRR